MKILSTASMQSETILVDSAEVKSQATSSDSGSQTRRVPKAKSLPPIQDGKPSAVVDHHNDTEELKRKLEEANEQMKLMNRSIQFSVDERSKDIVVKIVDKSSGEVISQIPPEEVLKLRERLQKMTGLIIEKTV